MNRFIVSIMALAIALALFHIYVFDVREESEDRPSDRLGDYGVYVGRAKSLLATGTFNYRGTGYFNNSDHGPGYPTMIALAFLLLGANKTAIVVLNLICFAGAVFFLWRISRYFLAGWWEFVPPFMLAVFWGAFTRVALPNYELFSLLLITLFFFSFFRYREAHSFLWLALSALVFALWVLERPIVLYFFPIFLFFLIVWHADRRK